MRDPFGFFDGKDKNNDNPTITAGGVHNLKEELVSASNAEAYAMRAKRESDDPKKAIESLAQAVLELAQALKRLERGS